MNIGDRVLVEMKSRGCGPGGWKTECKLGKVDRLGRVNIRVELDEYYFGFFHWKKPERIKLVEEEKS